MCVSLSIKISETERLITPESLEKLRIGCGQVLGYLEMERSQKNCQTEYLREQVHPLVKRNKNSIFAQI